MIPITQTGQATLAIFFTAILATFLGLKFTYWNSGISGDQTIMRACLIFPYSMLIKSQTLALLAGAFQFQIYGFSILFAWLRNSIWKTLLIILSAHGIATALCLLLRS